MTVTSKIAITFHCTHAQRERWLLLTAHEMSPSLNDWIVETLDNYANDRLDDE